MLGCRGGRPLRTAIYVDPASAVEERIGCDDSDAASGGSPLWLISDIVMFSSLGSWFICDSDAVHYVQLCIE